MEAIQQVALGDVDHNLAVSGSCLGHLALPDAANRCHEHTHADGHQPSRADGSGALTVPDETRHFFHARILDDDPILLEQTYALRYQVYCLERGFLNAEDYPAHLEIDGFDRHSVHVGVLDAYGAVAGTARLVEPSVVGLPLFGHCHIVAGETDLHSETNKVVEVSRLAVSRNYRRRRDDGFYGLQGATAVNSRTTEPDSSDRRNATGLLVTLYRELYQASKRRGFTHWLVATEKSLQRLVSQYGFPFRVIGPEVEYFGRVAPYLMDLREFDKVILSGRFGVLVGFLDGLESEFMPRIQPEETCTDGLSRRG